MAFEEKKNVLYGIPRF